MQTPTSLGKTRRLARLFNAETGRTVISPLDDSLLAGPEGGLRNLENKIDQIVTGGADAILAFQGLFNRYNANLKQCGCILNITASTIRSAHTRKVLVGSVRQALEMDMDAVAVHVNMGSKHESEMLTNLGAVSQECQRANVPLLAIIYPRTERLHGGDDNYYDLLSSGPDRYAQLVRHATRIGVELGADIVKVPYTGTIESFQTVIDSACGVPVVIAGGPEKAMNVILDMTYEAVKAGAAGIAGGRNAFHRRDASAVITALRNVVHNGMHPAEALATFDATRERYPYDIYEPDLPLSTMNVTDEKPAWIEE